jgi:hypothetical protein
MKSDLHMARDPPAHKLIVSNGPVRVTVPLKTTSQAPSRPRARKGSGQFAHERPGSIPVYEMAGSRGVTMAAKKWSMSRRERGRVRRRRPRALLAGSRKDWRDLHPNHIPPGLPGR